MKQKHESREYQSSASRLWSCARKASICLRFASFSFWVGSICGETGLLENSVPIEGTMVGKISSFPWKSHRPGTWKGSESMSSWGSWVGNIFSKGNKVEGSWEGISVKKGISAAMYIVSLSLGSRLRPYLVVVCSKSFRTGSLNWGQKLEIC